MDKNNNSKPKTDLGQKLIDFSLKHCKMIRATDGRFYVTLDGKTTIASLVLSTVEQGTSLATLVDLIAEKIDTSRSAKLMNAVVATLGVPPQLVTSLSIDLKATRDSLRFIAATDVPRPVKSSGVLSMNWIANLDSISSIEAQLDSLLKDF